LNVFVVYTSLVKTGLFDLLTQANTLKSEAAVAEFLRTTVFQFLKDNVNTLLLYGIIAVLLSFIFLSWARSVRFGLMKDLLLKKKVSLGNSFKYIKLYFWRFVKLQLIAMALWFVLAFVGLFFAGLLVKVMPALVVLMILFFLLGLALYFGLFFSKQILVLDNKSAWDAIKLSVQLFKKKKWFVLKTFLVIFVSIVVLNILTNVIQAARLSFVGDLVAIVILIALGLWMSLFTLDIYKQKAKV
jgi:hypothetical protein|tara:strand:+ start:9354 stop:10082 length:729 start_codon:yes stop_codon:yes gene_type:complete